MYVDVVSKRLDDEVRWLDSSQARNISINCFGLAMGMGLVVWAFSLKRSRWIRS